MRWVMAFFAALLLAGCTSFRDFRAAQVAEMSGDWDQAVLHYLSAAANDPENLQYRASVLRAKGEASQLHVKKGEEARAAGSLERSLVEYQQAVELDPTNQYAEVEMQRVRHDLEARAKKEAGGEETIDDAEEVARRPPAAAGARRARRSRSRSPFLARCPCSTSIARSARRSASTSSSTAT